VHFCQALWSLSPVRSLCRRARLPAMLSTSVAQPS